MCGGLEDTLKHKPKSPSFRLFCCKINVEIYIRVLLLCFCQANYDHDASHFDEDVFWLHISVKDPIAAAKKSDIGENNDSICNVFILMFCVNLSAFITTCACV